MDRQVHACEVLLEFLFLHYQFVCEEFLRVHFKFKDNRFPSPSLPLFLSLSLSQPKAVLVKNSILSLRALLLSLSF